MRDIAWIVLKDLRQQIRDRTIFIFGLIAPLAIAAALSLAFGDFFQNDEAVTFKFGVSNADSGGAISEGFGSALTALEQEGLVDITFYRDRTSLDEAVEEGEVDAGFFLPQGFSQAVIQGADAQITVVANPSSSVVTGVAASIARQFTLEVASASVAGATAAILAGLGPQQMIELGMAASQAPPTAQLAAVETQVRQLDGATYYSAGAAIFFTMFVVGTGLLSLLEERKRHTLARLLSTPITPGRILAAKFILSFVVGVGSVGLFMVFSGLLLGANWVDLPVTALLVMAAVAASAGIVSLVAGWARNAEQAQNFQSVVAVTMGILGGTFFPIAGGSTLLNALSLGTPHAWFMRGLGDLSGGGGLQEVTTPLLVLGGITVVTLTFSVLGARRSLRT
ncbi:MAG: ABC transporter permease [bacterium]|nr:ABC transporter permease [Acidimicrobiia bacterium]MCY4649518.1 ABC transporter permease [bacterium]